MKVCLLVDRLGHPVLEAAAYELAEKHGATVTFVDVRTVRAPDDADVYLLKSRRGDALAAARRAELEGASVINSVSATMACLDRASMAQRMRDVGLPFPDTWSAPTLHDVITSPKESEPSWPVIVKSRRSRRGDLVGLVRSSAELDDLAYEWRDEAVIVQSVVRHDGWDRKLWSIGGRLHAALRPAAFGELAGKADTLVPLEELPDGIDDLARAVGHGFELDLFGVDVLVTERGPVVVDVNPFPGFRRVPAAGQALAAHVIGLRK